MSENSQDSSILKLRNSNPYVSGYIIEFENGDQELIRNITEWKGSDNDKYHTVRQSDFIDKIAYDYYQNIVENPEWYWWVICDANNIENPLDLSELVGTEIVIPDLIMFALINNK